MVSSSRCDSTQHNLPSVIVRIAIAWCSRWPPQTLALNSCKREDTVRTTQTRIGLGLIQSLILPPSRAQPTVTSSSLKASILDTKVLNSKACLALWKWASSSNNSQNWARCSSWNEICVRLTRPQWLPESVTTLVQRLRRCLSHSRSSPFHVVLSIFKM